jgi:hypothetical protein
LQRSLNLFDLLLKEIYVWETLENEQRILAIEILAKLIARSGRAGLWRSSFFFCRSNCLRELNSILYPLRITSCHGNGIHAEHARRTLGKPYSSNQPLQTYVACPSGW